MFCKKQNRTLYHLIFIINSLSSAFSAFSFERLPSTQYARNNGCEILLDPRWVNLGKDTTDSANFGSKWVLVGVITLRKTSKQPVILRQLTFEWLGKPISCLFGSLYKGYPNKNFLPLEENLICDSLWDSKQQTLKCIFDEKLILGPLSIFYLVLTVPASLEKTISCGALKLLYEQMPAPYNGLKPENRELILDLSEQF